MAHLPSSWRFGVHFLSIWCCSTGLRYGRDRDRRFCGEQHRRPRSRPGWPQQRRLFALPLATDGSSADHQLLGNAAALAAPTDLARSPSKLARRLAAAAEIPTRCAGGHSTGSVIAAAITARASPRSRSGPARAPGAADARCGHAGGALHPAQTACATSGGRERADVAWINASPQGRHEFRGLRSCGGVGCVRNDTTGCWSASKEMVSPPLPTFAWNFFAFSVYQCWRSVDRH